MTKLVFLALLWVASVAEGMRLDLNSRSQSLRSRTKLLASGELANGKADTDEKDSEMETKVATYDQRSYSVDQLADESRYSEVVEQDHTYDPNWDLTSTQKKALEEAGTDWLTIDDLGHVSTDEEKAKDVLTKETATKDAETISEYNLDAFLKANVASGDSKTKDTINVLEESINTANFDNINNDDAPFVDTEAGFQNIVKTLTSKMNNEEYLESLYDKVDLKSKEGQQFREDVLLTLRDEVTQALENVFLDVFDMFAETLFQAEDFEAAEFAEFAAKVLDTANEKAAEKADTFNTRMDNDVKNGNVEGFIKAESASMEKIANDDSNELTGGDVVSLGKTYNKDMEASPQDALLDSDDLSQDEMDSVFETIAEMNAVEKEAREVAEDFAVGYNEIISNVNEELSVETGIDDDVEEKMDDAEEKNEENNDIDDNVDF